MMIQTVDQLNKFVAKAGVKSVCQLLPKLIEKKELITPTMAKLVTSQSYNAPHP